jgi:hypothetical protein
MIGGFGKRSVWRTNTFPLRREERADTRGEPGARTAKSFAMPSRIGGLANT